MGTISHSKPFIKKNINPANPKRLTQRASEDFCFGSKVSCINSKLNVFASFFKFFAYRFALINERVLIVKFFQASNRAPSFLSR